MRGQGLRSTAAGSDAVTSPRSPRVVKGALVGLDPFNPLASVIVFQYNPDTVTRSLRARAAGDEAAQGEALRLKGPPEETLRFDVEIDAADQLERGDAIASSVGLTPTLASLEMLLYPKSALVLANQALALAGVIEVVPPEAPLTVLVWNASRVVPVRLSEFSITEEAFDPSLNPIRAKAELSLRVLTYDDLGLLSPGGSLFLVHQLAKEALATIGGAGAIGGSLSASVSSGG